MAKAFERTRRVVRGVSAAMRAAMPFRQRPSGICDLITAAYLLLDTRGIVRDLNPTACRVIGQSRRALIGGPLAARVHADDRERFADHLRRCRSSHDVTQTDVRLVAADGDLPVRLYSRCVRVGPAMVFPTVALNLTEHREIQRAREAAEEQRDIANQQREAALAAEAAKDRLIAIVSHELRDPLSPALMAAEGLASWTTLPQPARELANVIRRNIELEARLIDDLLDAARIARGQLELHLTDVDAHRLLLDAVGSVRPAATDKGVAITTDLRASQHVVCADAMRLRQVFWNLLHNAVKFNDANGSVQVRTLMDHGRLRVIIRDSGIGMDDATMARLFQSFAQPALQGRRGGLGLGLSIARQIVEAHGGTITATSPGLGGGAMFEVELALSAAAKAAGTSPARPHVAARRLRGSGAVLIVDDDRDTRAMLELFLRERGYETTVVSTLADAVKALDRPWHAVLADIGLMDGSGLELAHYARRLADPPRRLIALSGYGSVEDSEASRQAGFDVHLVKPIDLVSLLAALTPTRRRTKVRNTARG